MLLFMLPLVRERYFVLKGSSYPYREWCLNNGIT